MGRRSRSRSRERGDRSRRRSRSRSRDRTDRRRSGFSTGDHASQVAAQAQQAAMMALQQQQLQKQLLAQQQLMQQQAATQSATTAQSNKKQREVYVGNLTIGVVSDTMLRDLFNSCLAHLAGIEVAPGQDISAHPDAPVVTVRLDSTGRFGFVELRTEELTAHSMNLDKVELCGRHVNVGRPKGYLESMPEPKPPTQGGPAAFAAQVSQEPTNVLRLDNLVRARLLLDANERNDLMTDVTEEAGKYGALQGVAAPLPPPMVTALEPARVYLRYTSSVESAAAKKVFDGRTFDGNTVSARYVYETAFTHAAAGIWDADVALAPAGGQQQLPPGPPAGPPMPPPPGMPLPGPPGPPPPSYGQY